MQQPRILQPPADSRFPVDRPPHRFTEQPMGVGGKLLVLGAIASIAILTKPSDESFRRAVAAKAKKEAGGGVMGWLASKSAKALSSAAHAVGGLEFSDYAVVVVVTPTPSGKELQWGFTWGEVSDWVAVGAFNTWFIMSSKSGCTLVRAC